MVVFVVMGVCGSGKTTVGQALASKIQCSFRDADEFHSHENKLKMSQGLPLTDEDRMPWLLSIHKYIRGLLDCGSTGVVTCSSLKMWYRHILITGDTSRVQQYTAMFQTDILFVYLKGSAEILKHRLKHRTGHFMPETLLQSQLDTLEVPDDTESHITVDIAQDVEDIVAEVIRNRSL